MGTNGERSQWQMYVSKKLEELESKQDSCKEEIHLNKIATLNKINDLEKGLCKELSDFKLIASQDISILKVKSGLWGAIAGAIPVIVALIIYFITRG